MFGEVRCGEIQIRAADVTFRDSIRLSIETTTPATEISYRAYNYHIQTGNNTASGLLTLTADSDNSDTSHEVPPLRFTLNRRVGILTRTRVSGVTVETVVQHITDGFTALRAAEALAKNDSLCSEPNLLDVMDMHTTHQYVAARPVSDP